MELTKYIKDKNLLLLFILFIATLILHVYALDTLNPYLQIDEAAIGYSSWCLGEYGTDRYLNSYPIYIKNFYGGQSIAYAWLIVPFIKLFGLNLFSIRLPMAIMYSIAIFPLYHLLKDEEKNLGIVACSLYTFSSIIILAGRTALDCYLMLPVTIFLFDQIYSAIKTQKTIHFVLSAILSGLILYTYALSYLIMPIFLLIVFALAIKYKKISIKQSVIFICILLTISIPIFLQVITILVIKEPWKIGPFTFITMPRDVTSELSKHSWKNVVNYVMSSLITDSLRFD